MTTKHTWTRQGRCISLDGEPAIMVDRVINDRTGAGTLDPVTCDAIADLVHRVLSTTDLDALVKAWMRK